MNKYQEDPSHKNRFGLSTYIQTLSCIVKQPKLFYQEKSAEKSWKKPLYVLLISALIFSLASVVAGMANTPLVMGLVYLANAIGMVFIASAIGYVLIRLFQKSFVSFQRVFAIYAYASGAVLVLAWMPYMLWITEPWRWWMVGCGLVKDIGFTVKGAATIVILNILIIVTSTWWILSMMPFNG